MIPLMVCGFAGTVQSIVKNSWLYSNFYLGIELSLAAFAHGLLNVAEEAHHMEKFGDPSIQIGDHMFYTVVCILAAVGALLGSIALEQRIALKKRDEDYQRLNGGVLLGLVGNLLGGSVLMMFILMKLQGVI